MSAKMKTTDRPAKTRRLKDNKKHTLLTYSRVTRYGIRNFTRNSWLTVAATAVMTITLLIVFATVVVSHMLNSTVTSLREKIDISIYMKPTTSDDTLRNLKGIMQLADNVRSVTTSSSKDEYNKYIDQIKGDSAKIQAISSLSESGLDPSQSFSAVMNIKVNDLSRLSSIKETVQTNKLFQEWIDNSRTQTYDSDQQSTINRISSWASFSQRAGLIAGTIFLVISVLVIFNTIRMAIFSRRDEIEMMRSVGAEKFFIRGPFLIEAEMYGLLAALVATAIGYLLFIWIAPGLNNYGISVAETQSLMTEWYWLVIIIMVSSGMLIGYASAWLATRRYLK